MCRNIQALFNFEPPATEEEIRMAAWQCVRKVSGFNKPSQASVAAFFAAVDARAVAATPCSASETPEHSTEEPHRRSCPDANTQHSEVCQVIVS
jgi:hypothetical protein